MWSKRHNICWGWDGDNPLIFSFVFTHSFQQANNLEASWDKNSSREEKATTQIIEESDGPVDSIQLVEFNKVSVKYIYEYNTSFLIILGGIVWRLILL